MIAAVRGPYWTGACAPAGAAPLVRCPQPQCRSISWCSVTSARTGCRSKTWRRSTPVTGRPASPAPHRPQQPGSWRTSRSGRATCASVIPVCPSCPPGLRPLRFRSDRGRGAGLPSPSLDGGLEEFRGFCRNRASSAAIRSRACASSARACSSAVSASASSPRSDATSPASTSDGGGPSSPGTQGRYPPANAHRTHFPSPAAPASHARQHPASRCRSSVRPAASARRQHLPRRCRFAILDPLRHR
jgi:hypothetical protein